MASVYTPARRRVPRLVKSDTTQFPRWPPKCVLVKHLRSYVCHVVTRRYLFESDWFCPHGCLNRKVAQDDVSHLAEPLPADESYGSVRARLPLHHGVADPSVLRHPFHSHDLLRCHTCSVQLCLSGGHPECAEISTPTSQGSLTGLIFTDNTPWRVFLSPAQSLSRGTASLESGFWQASAKPTIGNTFTHIPMFFNRSQSSSVNGATNLEKKTLTACCRCGLSTAQ